MNIEQLYYYLLLDAMENILKKLYLDILLPTSIITPTSYTIHI